ncbi:MAG: phage/plasmid primase, P4 family [Rubrobacteraceae bacterium]
MDTVKRYAADGIRPVPVPPGSKGPDSPGWQELRISPNDVSAHFRDGDNVGWILGPSGLLCVDLDTPEATRIWTALTHIHGFPGSLISGRPGAPASHAFYRVEGEIKQTTFKDIPTGDKARPLLEVLAGNHQVLVPPSVHPSGEAYDWNGGVYDPGQIVTVKADTLMRAAREAATVALIARHLPPIGQRHEYVLALAGFLLAPGRLSYEPARRMIVAAWNISGADAETVQEVQDAVEGTYNKMQAGEPVTGGPTADDIVPGLLDALAKIWSWSAKRASEKPDEAELRDRWMAANPHVYLSRAEWWNYNGATGLYETISENNVKATLWDVLEADPNVVSSSRLVTGVLHAVAARRELPDDIWDADLEKIVVSNGVLRITDRVLLEHSPEHYATTGYPFPYDPDAEYPRFQELLNWIDVNGEAYLDERAEELDTEVPDNGAPPSSLLQEFAGLALTADTSKEVAIWLVGKRGSGKSTFLEGLLTVMGNRAEHITLSNMINNQFGLARLPGKTLVTGTEQPGIHIKATETYKALVSGEPIEVNEKYKRAYSYKPIAKVIWAMERTPTIDNADDGAFRRTRIVPFVTAPERADTALKADIAAEGSGILNWLLDGYDRYKTHGLSDPPAVRWRTDEWLRTGDLAATFVEEACVTGPDAKTPPGDLYRAYSAWCTAKGHRAKSMTAVAAEWKRLGFERRKIKGYWYYKGVQVDDSKFEEATGVMALAAPGISW